LRSSTLAIRVFEDAPVNPVGKQASSGLAPDPQRVCRIQIIFLA